MAEGGKKSPQADDSVMRQLGSFASMGMEFIVAVLLPGAFGYWLDGKWQTSPWLMLLGGFFGFGVGLYMMLRASKRAMR
jgi:F0F1-type ATP synthase assembly protein I